MKPVDVQPSICFHFNKENNKEGPKFKIGDHVKISEYKKVFCESYVSNWSKEISVIKKVRNTVSWTYFIKYVKDKDETF